MDIFQKKVDQWFKKQGWQYWPPLEILARLVEEVGEFARLTNHVYGSKKKKTSEQEQDFEDEIGDIMHTLICFANSHNLNLQRAIKKSIDKVTTRDKDRYKKK